ncbi:DUF4386 family protein [Halobaculum marinum]|uniref:DUF4386 family protein n=1 Tax=Halobaculum marinum TaxID=3031996 RepID=A0ABD5WTB5_9EURY|nr:DUF4386 family protein [Halobaculum sp. DT55]
MVDRTASGNTGQIAIERSADGGEVVLRRAGGVAALVAAATFVVGFALFLTVLAAAGYGDDAARSVAFLLDNRALLTAWNLVIYVVFGTALVVLALALHRRLRDDTPVLAAVATVFGQIWAGLVIGAGMVANVAIGAVVDAAGRSPAEAEATWATLRAVENGLGGGNEIVGSLWVILVGWAAIRGGSLPRTVCYLGFVAGVAGLLTVVPGLGDLGAIFGFGLIAWFAWVGIHLLRAGGDDELTTGADPDDGVAAATRF